jgi:MoaD family protein
MPCIKLIASLRALTGMKELTVPGATVGEVLSDLVKQYPAVEAHLVGSGEAPPPIILVNGRPVSEMDTPVSENDEITILEPVAGG